MPEPTWTASLSDWADRAGVPVVRSGDYHGIQGEAIDLGFSVFYDKIIKKQFIDSCWLLNLHNSPLPRYQGIAPINWALKNGERYHGVTIHEVAPGIDDGPIIGQLTYSIDPEIDEVRDVYDRALRYGYVLFEETMRMLERIIPQPQDESGATYFSAADQVRLGERRSFTREQSRAGIWHIGR